MTLRTILVDDEILNLKNLEVILKNHFQEIEIIGLFQNAIDAKIFIKNNRVSYIIELFKQYMIS